MFEGLLVGWQGPDFLQSQEIVMPSQQFLQPDILPEQKGSVMSMVAKFEKVVGVGKVIDCCKFSSLGSLLRVTDYVLRFIYNVKSKMKGQSDFRDGEISVEEVDESKTLWVKYEKSENKI